MTRQKGGYIPFNAGDYCAMSVARSKINEFLSFSKDTTELPSIPPNLDEVAENYRRKSCNATLIPPIDGPIYEYGSSVKDAFKAGAEWTIKQLKRK